MVSSVLGVTGGELILRALTNLFARRLKTSGTASLLVSLPTVLVRVGCYPA